MEPIYKNRKLHLGPIFFIFEVDSGNQQAFRGKRFGQHHLISPISQTETSGQLSLPPHFILISHKDTSSFQTGVFLMSAVYLVRFLLLLLLLVLSRIVVSTGPGRDVVHVRGITLTCRRLRASHVIIWSVNRKKASSMKGNTWKL